MITWILGFLSFSFLIPPLLFVSMKNSGRPSQLYAVAGVGIASLAGYFVSVGLWPVSMFMVSHLVLYYFGLSALVAYRKSGAWLPAYINIAVILCMGLGWFIMLKTIEFDANHWAVRIIIFEGIASSLIIGISTYPVISLLNTSSLISKTWPFISWLSLATACGISGAWIGVAIYIMMIIIVFVGGILRRKIDNSIIDFD